MSEKYIIFNNKTISKNSFYRKKGLFKADNTDFDKILVSKNLIITKVHMNAFLDIIIAVILGHYPSSDFLK